MKNPIIAILVVITIQTVAFGATGNSNGSRTFSIGNDFLDVDSIVWGHPAGVVAGDTLTSEGNLVDGNLMVGASGLPGSPISISVGCNGLSDGENDYIYFKYSISYNSEDNGISISGKNNLISNCTIYNPLWDGLLHSQNITINNTIFNSIGGQTINTLSGSLTENNNFKDSDGDALFMSATDYHLRSSSPCINAGAIIAGLHDNDEPATDIAGTRVLTIPDIGAYEYSPQQLYFNSNATGAQENGTEEHPYHAFTDYSGASSGAFSAYSLRSGADLILEGSLGALDLSGLSDNGAIQIEAAEGAYASIASFSPNGPYTFFSSSVLSPEVPALSPSWLFILLLSILAIHRYRTKI